MKKQKFVKDLLEANRGKYEYVWAVVQQQERTKEVPYEEAVKYFNECSADAIVLKEWAEPSNCLCIVFGW